MTPGDGLILYYDIRSFTPYDILTSAEQEIATILIHELGSGAAQRQFAQFRADHQPAFRAKALIRQNLSGQQRTRGQIHRTNSR
jgi:hypothetical protein